MDMKEMVREMLMQRFLRTRGECDNYYDCAKRHERPTWVWSFMCRHSTQKYADFILDIPLTRNGVYGKVMTGWRSQVM